MIRVISHMVFLHDECPKSVEGKPIVVLIAYPGEAPPKFRCTACNKEWWAINPYDRIMQIQKDDRMSMNDDKMAIVKALRNLADLMEMADSIFVESFDIETKVGRDFLGELIQGRGYKKFNPTGMRHASIVMEYRLPPIKPNDPGLPPIGADW